MTTPKIVALVSAQGTACLETGLYGADDTPENRAKIEATYCRPGAWGDGDLPVPGTWIDVSDNEAFHYPANEEPE
jgi:hypothetical protein